MDYYNDSMKISVTFLNHNGLLIKSQEINWDDREEVRKFAAEANDFLRKAVGNSVLTIALD